MNDINLTSENFDEIVLPSDKPVLVDFWAPWCGPCKMMSPIVEELAADLDGFVVKKVNVDENSDLAQRFNILSIPTFLIFKNGQVVDQFSGSMDIDTLRERVTSHI